MVPFLSLSFLGPGPIEIQVISQKFPGELRILGPTYGLSLQTIQGPEGNFGPLKILTLLKQHLQPEPQALQDLRDLAAVQPMPSLRQWYRYFSGPVLDKHFVKGTITA